MVDDETKRLVAAIFERVTAGRILRDGTTSMHSPHDAVASIEAAKIFAQSSLLDITAKFDVPHGSSLP